MCNYFQSCQSIQFPLASPLPWFPELWVPLCWPRQTSSEAWLLLPAWTFHTLVNQEKTGLMPALGHLTPSSPTLQRPWMEPGREAEPARRKDRAEGRSSTSSTSGKVAPCTPSTFSPIPVLLHANATLCIGSFLKKSRNSAGLQATPLSAGSASSAWT